MIDKNKTAEVQAFITGWSEGRGGFPPNHANGPTGQFVKKILRFNRGMAAALLPLADQLVDDGEVSAETFRAICRQPTSWYFRVALAAWIRFGGDDPTIQFVASEAAEIIEALPDFSSSASPTFNDVVVSLPRDISTRAFRRQRRNEAIEICGVAAAEEMGLMCTGPGEKNQNYVRESLRMAKLAMKRAIDRRICEEEMTVEDARAALAPTIMAINKSQLVCVKEMAAASREARGV